jgi:protocatechuate 3,4-dioxygenase beta subunit
MAATRVRVGIPLVACLALSMTALAQRPSADPRTGLVVGQIVDAGTGRPLSSVVVSLQGASLRGRAGEPNAPPPRILTGSDGRFVFRDLPEGGFSVTASKPGWADGAYGRLRAGGPAQQLRMAAAGRAGDIVIPMWKLGAITGRVTDEAGEPVVGLQMRAFRRMVVGGSRRFAGGTTAMTDDRGIYRFGSLVPGEYLVAVTPRSVSVPLSALTQRLDPAVVPPPGFTPTQMQGSALALRLGDALVDSRGGLTPPPPSGGRSFTYPLTFYPFGAAAAHAEPISVSTGEERTAIDLQIQPVPTVRVTGTVVGPESVAGSFTVRLVPASASDVDMEQDVATAATDGSGRFEFPAVPEGEYVLHGQGADREARATAGDPMSIWWTALPVHAGREDILGLTVPLQPGLRVRGRIEFDGARGSTTGVSQIPLVIERADGMASQGFARGSRVDASGAFASAGVPAGRYIVRVTGSPVGWMFKSAMFDGRDISVDPLELRGGDATGVVITFTDRWTGVQGLVQDRRGAPDPAATVVVFPTHQAAWTDYGPSPRRLRSARTGNEGTYAISSLPPGDYYIVALPDEQANDWQDPQVLAELARGAAHIVITDGTKPTQNLRTRVLSPERSR